MTSRFTYHVRATLFLAFFLALLFACFDILPALAGVYDADGDVTYKEYWIPHSEYTGGIDTTLPGCIDTTPQGGTFYLEPVNSCSKVVRLTIDDDFANALKVELYLDIWRNHVPPSAAFKLNNGPVHQTPVGENWSRTPYIATIDKNELVRGVNTITFLDTDGAYHIHDAALRIYFDATHPLRDANGLEITAPQGRLLTVWADNGLFDVSSGGTLLVDDDQLVLTAQVDSPAKFVEFHGFYAGYDEDNDGQFTDWHSAARNNFHPGGTTPSPLGGTINHIGTVATNSPGPYTMYWSLPHVINQSGVKFKIRIVDSNYVVREGAGGISAPFTLSRSKDVQSFYDAGFVDAVLYHGGNKPLTVTRTIQLPSALSLPTYQEAYFLGAYWQNPNIAINNGSKFKAFSGGEDSWALSIRKISPSLLSSGKNNISYTYTSGFGQFIEKPGGMIVLKQTTRAADNSAPIIVNRTPAANATEVAPESNIVLTIRDNPGRGVALNTIRLKLNGTVVNPVITGSPDEYLLTYDPPTDFPLNTTVTVAVDACDYANKCMAATSYVFAVRRSTHTLAVNKSGSGTVNVNPAKPLYTYGDVVQLTATPVSGWLFVNWIVDQGKVDGWWNSDWHYRLPLTVAANNVARVERPVETTVNFTALFANLGENGAFDPNTLRMVEVDGAGVIVDSAVPVQFDPAVDYDATTNAAGTLIFLMEGNTAGNASRHYQLYFDQVGSNLPTPTVADQVVVTDGIYDEGQDSFRIETTNATYLFHKEGCGFSSMIDINGNDWIDYHPEPENSSGAFRGLPNLVPPPDGLFHPGHLIGDATLLSSGVLKESIRCITYDNKWETQWDFFPKFARMTLLRKDATKSYWFLYEGTPGGVLENSDDKIVRSDGSVTNLSGNWTGDLAAPEWVYLYDTDVDNAATLARSLFLIHHEDDTVVDSYRPNGSGSGKMTIFGFGRDGSGNNPFMTQAPQHFTIGFMDETAFGDAATVINSSYRDLIITPAAAELRGPVSGEVVTTPDLSLTIHRDTVVTATFTNEIYQIQTAVIGNGSVSRTPDRALYARNEAVSLTAQAQPGWSFIGWSGDATGMTNPLGLIADTSKSITATFALINYTVALSTDGQGAVTMLPDQASYHFGDSLTITATAAPGWHFAGWSDDSGLGDNPRSLIVTENKVIQTRFVRDDYQISSQTVGSGTVTLSPAQSIYYYGDNIVVTAAAAPGWHFGGWSGDLTGVAPSAPLAIDGSKSVTATFIQDEYTLTLTVIGDGMVDVKPQQATYHYGDVVTLTPQAANGWHFAAWGGDSTGSSAPLTMTVTGDLVFTVTFVDEAYTLATNVNGEGTLVVTPTQQLYLPGSTVQLHAIPAPGWRFSGWQGGLAGVANPATLTISANQQVTATFVQQQYSITTRVVDGDGMVVNAGAITLSPPVDGIGYRYGESVTLTLTLPSGWTFIGWAEPIADKELVTTITVTDDLTVNAVIAPQHYALTVQVVDAVEKPQSTSLLAYSAPQDGIGYRFGEVVTLTPKEANGWRFDHWSGDLNGTAAPATLTMDADKQIVAHFIKRQYQLTLSVGGQGSAVGGHVELDPKGPYDYGQVVTLTAVADPGYQFISWVISPTVEAQVEGADSPSTSPIITVTMTTDFTYQAQFQAVADIRIYLPVIQR